MKRPASFPRSVFLLILVGFAGCGRPPQIGTDKAAIKAVDALYTAVSLRDTVKIDACIAALKQLRQADKLPEAATQTLDSIVAQAKEGQWEPALDRLTHFMDGQQR